MKVILVLFFVVPKHFTRAHFCGKDSLYTEDWAYTDNNYPEDVAFPSTLIAPARLQQVQAGKGRIINGDDAEKNQFPYQAHLKIFSALNPFGSIVCGGVIISENFVLTAAHCFDPTQLRWYVSILYGSNSEAEMLSFNTTSIFLHPKFNSTVLTDDIALLKLPCHLRFPVDERVKPVALPREHICEDWVKSKVITSGFGSILEGNDTVILSPTLKFVTLEIISNVDCLHRFYPYVTPYHICAVSRNKNQHQGSCRGDSGGPLVAYVYGQPVLIGLVCFVDNLCSGGPTGFTRVAPYIKWIDSIMNPWLS